ncbi:hypothetical protein QQ008_27630 [Fulvivirgaceae bacterium BMA10]|uniref:Uncharacterized protein n=1 Tax=Splendidivirga corallicola TaxID=3051826 RepID=A0ABT8KWL5_9BACT|nr:hypothetical protein [Fulvivirgaceae bacterium BMA10]
MKELNDRRYTGIITLAMIFIAIEVSSQNLSLVESISINSPSAVSMDRNGTIYIADNRGDITKYDASGKEQLKFSPDQPGAVNNIEAWSGLKIFVFYETRQEYIWLDRFLNTSRSFLLDDPDIGRASIATASSDQNIWILDDINLDLLKYDPNFNRILLKTSLMNVLPQKDQYEITHLKEYQNSLYIGLKDIGILVFDNLGNYVKRLPILNIDHFEFLNEELYYQEGRQIKFYHLYNSKERSFNLPQSNNNRFVLIRQNRFFLLGNREMSIYEMK